MDADRFLISQGASLRVALTLIEKNNHGIILTVDSSNKVIGLVTDGDVRRYLLKADASLDDPVSLCANTEFLWEDPSTSRELLLKKLDHRIRVLPLLDENKKLVEGNKDNPISVADQWIFKKPLSDKGPSWQLISTQSEG